MSRFPHSAASQPWPDISLSFCQTLGPYNSPSQGLMLQATGIWNIQITRSVPRSLNSPPFASWAARTAAGWWAAVWQAGNTSISGSNCKATWEAISLRRDYTLQFLKTTIRNSYFTTAKVSKPDGMISVLQTIIQLIQKNVAVEFPS